jgi:GNAT superfamily N-acetyltransferase
MILKCETVDFSDIYEIINDGATAYKGIIPPDRWHEPYMSEKELYEQIEDGVQFWGYREGDRMQGVMGIQYKTDVTLIRHAYVRSENRNRGIGGKLLSHLLAVSAGPVLIGTWADATWAIGFYQKNGFRLLPKTETRILLLKYWSIPERQAEVSVVLASPDWNTSDPS